MANDSKTVVPARLYPYSFVKHTQAGYGFSHDQGSVFLVRGAAKKIKNNIFLNLNSNEILDSDKGLVWYKNAINYSHNNLSVATNSTLNNIIKQINTETGKAWRPLTLNDLYKYTDYAARLGKWNIDNYSPSLFPSINNFNYATDLVYWSDQTLTTYISRAKYYSHSLLCLDPFFDVHTNECYIANDSNKKLILVRDL